MIFFSFRTWREEIVYIFQVHACTTWQSASKIMSLDLVQMELIILVLVMEQKSVSSFTQISPLGEYEIKTSSTVLQHSLFEPRKSKILYYGYNKFSQLLIRGSSEENFYSPRETTIALWFNILHCWKRFFVHFSIK